MRPPVIMFALVTLFVSSRASAQISDHPWWSVGPKIGYTFGEQGGVTGGFEVTYFPATNSLPFAITFDVTGWPKARTAIHLGAEAWFYVGLDVGPTLFLDHTDWHVGMSATVWDGLFLYPYYEIGIPFNGEIFQSVGGYLKVPINYPEIRLG